MARTDPAVAEAAKQRAIENNPKLGTFSIQLCPACNEPYFCEDPNPNDFVHDPDAGEYGNDKAAYQYSPANLIDRDLENPWDRICVFPRAVEYDDGMQLQVAYGRHDFSSEDYQLWQAEVERLDRVEARREANQSIEDFDGGDE